MNLSLRVTGIIAVFSALAACGGGGGSSDSKPTVEPTQSGAGLLKPVSSSRELEDSLRAGLASTQYLASSQEPVVLLDFSSGGLQAAPGGSAGEASFSRTNLQEMGVDEADIVKYDGEILYVLNRNPSITFATLDLDGSGTDSDPMPVEPDGGIGDGAGPPPALGVSETSIVAPAPSPSVIHLLRTNPTAPSTVLLAQINPGNTDYSIDGMYLAQSDLGKQLITIGQDNPFIYWELFANDYYWRNSKTIVQSWDVNTAETPLASWSLQLEGSLLASRRIGNMLYLATRYSPTVDDIIAYPQNEDDVETNRDLIADTALADLMPDMIRNAGEPEELLSPSDCYIPNEQYTKMDVPPSGGSLITVTAIDLDAPDSVNSTCINTYASGFYASKDAIYLTANGSGNSTLIHKIKLIGATPEYRGSGEVPGYIGTSNPAFLMSEIENDIRIVSSSWDSGLFPLPVIEGEDGEIPAAQEKLEDDGFGRHRLTILRESADGTELQQVSQLPNASRPAHIGKPDEEVYAVRFMQERAYVVTFEVIDPLYVLDLADASDPKIAGELEIPGFSTLLQPIGDTLLLGIGHDVPADGQSVIQGVKVALFNVADLSSPVSQGEIVVGKRGSYSAALYDYHALTLLETNDSYRVAIPIVRHEQEQTENGETGTSNPWYYYGWSDTGLYMFDIDPAAGALALSGTLVVNKPTPENPYDSNNYNSRSVLHDDAVFYISGTMVLAHRWGQSTE